MNEDIEKRAEEYADNQQVPSSIEVEYLKEGYIAGATEERERGKRFAEWVNSAVYFPEEKKWYYDPLSSEMHTTDEMFKQFLVE